MREIKRKQKKKNPRTPKKTNPDNANAQKRKDLQALGTYMTDFLNSFVVVGYDFEGNSVSISNYHNPQEYNSLSVLVRDYLIALQNQNSPPEG